MCHIVDRLAVGGVCIIFDMKKITGRHAWSMVMDIRESGMSLVDIAARVKCSRQTIYAWRRNTSTISPAIAENLGVLLEEVERNGEPS